MKKFIIQLSLFSLPLLLCGGTLEYLAQKIPNDFRLKKEMLEEHAHDTEILVLGSSHAFYGINPEYISTPSLNAAYVSQSLNVDLAILEKYFSAPSRLKSVILPVSYFTLYRTLEQGPEHWRSKDYIIYSDIQISSNPRYRFEITGNTPKSFLKKIESYYKKKRDPITSSSKGWGLNFSSEIDVDLAESGPSRAAIHTTDDTRLLERNQQTLLCIQHFLQARNINLYLFMPPAFQTYRTRLNPEQLELSTSIPAEMAATYSNTYYINLLSDETFQEEDFFDADHLNEIGAKKLSTLLEDKIINHEFH
jgi:hypothetical protein